MKRLVIISLSVLLILSLTSGFSLREVDATPVSPEHSSALPTYRAYSGQSINFIQAGLCGEIVANIVAMELANGEEAVLLGTSRGLYIVAEGTLLNYIPTPNHVMDIALLEAHLYTHRRQSLQVQVNGSCPNGAAPG